MSIIRIFHASDLHFGAEDRAALDWFAAQVHVQRPDAIIITGDITMRARHSEFAAAAAWLSALDRPLSVEIGNHDMPYFNPIERFANPYRRYHAMADMVERAIDLPGLAIVPLRTTAPAQWRFNWSKGVVKAKQLAATLAAIAKLPVSHMTLVAAHHPLVETGTRGTALTRGGTRALDALTKAGVTAVLSGHVHDAFDLMHHGTHGNIRMIGAGTLSERLRTTRPSYNELVITGGNLAVAAHLMP